MCTRELGLDLGAVEEDRLVRWTPFSFTSHGRPCTCAIYLGNLRHMNAPWNDDKPLLEVWFANCGSSHSCGRTFDTCFLPIHCCKPGTPQQVNTYRSH